jgi:hypothetical protein
VVATDAPVVEGVVKSVEGSDIDRALGRRLLGRWRFFVYIRWLIALLMAVVGGLVIVGFAPADPGYAGPLAILVFVVFLTWGNHRIGRLVRRRLRQRVERFGILLQWQVAFEVAEEGLNVRSEFSSSTIYWKGIVEILPTKDCWLLLLKIDTPVYFPRDIFPTVEAERAFIAALLSHVDEASRMRSTAARLFVSGA